ncbi:MAG: 4-hydroxy-3-methylbut-2-en-1-yl diphosphate synthase [Bacteroidia bacterium]|nr:4-hydroxy-3-methylbut-2-en-1-yl diphosphate synthase [Bacteroidia bacterium]
MRKVVVKVGNVEIGQDGEIIIQTMCNTPTADIEATYKQCKSLYSKGAQIIRVTTQGPKEVKSLQQIKDMLLKDGISVPLVADVHFSYNVAHLAAKIAHKVRINPGNFAKDHKTARKEFSNLVTICKEHGTSIRIGVNHGSLGEPNTQKYGNTPEGMAEVAFEWIKMAQEFDFDQIIISLKASNPLVMTKAYRILYDKMLDDGVLYPLHLGVTEAGNGEEGRIKSALGLATLLKDGIGSTIRVSLTEPPENELPVARIIADYFSGNPKMVKSNLPKDYFCNSYQEFIIKAACDYGPLLLDKELDDISIKAYINGAEVGKEQMERFVDNLMQGARRRFTKPEYIACPGCGRTLYNLEEVFKQVKERTSHLVGYNIAVMGCIVNGPGEMADADYGYVGEGKGKVSIYRGNTPVYRSVPQDEAIDKLLELIEQDARNRVFLPRNG